MLLFKMRYQNILKLSRTISSLSCYQYRSVFPACTHMSQKIPPNFLTINFPTLLQISQFSDWDAPILKDGQLMPDENLSTDFLNEEHEDLDDHLYVEEQDKFAPLNHRKHDLDELLRYIIKTVDQETVLACMSVLYKAIQSSALTCPLYLFHERNDFQFVMSEVQKLYSQLSSQELVDILHILIEMEIPTSKMHSKSVSYLLKILYYHLDDLPLEKMIHLHKSLRRILKHDDPMLYTLNILIGKCLDEDILSDFRIFPLLQLCDICVKNCVKNTYKVFAELCERDLRTNTASFVLWRILQLPFHQWDYAFMVPPDAEVIVDTAAKQCFTVVANNIKHYSPAMLVSLLSMIGHVFRAGKRELVYHEYFLQDVARRAATEENWSFDQLSFTTIKLYFCDFVNDELLSKTARELVKRPINEQEKSRALIFPFSCMDERPDGLQNFLSVIDKKHFLWASTIWSLGHKPTAILKQLFNPTSLASLFKRAGSVRRWMRSLLLLNFMMEKDPLLSPFCLSEANKKQALKLFREELKVQPRRCSLKNIVEDSSNYARSVLYRQSILIDSLLVCDDMGRLVPVAPVSNATGLCSYEHLNIDASLRRIAVMNIGGNFVMRPNGNVHGSEKLLISALESDGFLVIPSIDSTDKSECEERLREQLTLLGVDVN